MGPDAEGSAPSSTSVRSSAAGSDRIVGSDLALIGAALGGFVLGALVVGALAPPAKLAPACRAARDPGRSRRAGSDAHMRATTTCALARNAAGHSVDLAKRPGGRIVVRPQADATPACRSHRHHGKRRSSPHDRIAGTDHSRSQCQRDMRGAVGRRTAFGARGRASEARHATSQRATSSPT